MTVGPLAGALEHAVMGPSPVRMVGRGTTSRTGYWTDLNLSLEQEQEMQAIMRLQIEYGTSNIASICLINEYPYQRRDVQFIEVRYERNKDFYHTPEVYYMPWGVYERQSQLLSILKVLQFCNGDISQLFDKYKTRIENEIGAIKYGIVVNI